MNKIEKLFRKISKKDREDLLDLVGRIIDGKDGLNIVKIKNTDFFRLKHKNFRIIFHKNDGEVVIDSIRLRNENTYRNL